MAAVEGHSTAVASIVDHPNDATATDDKNRIDVTETSSSLSGPMANLSLSQPSNEGQTLPGNDEEEISALQQQMKSDPVDLISDAMDFISNSNIVPTSEGTVAASADSITDTEVVTPAANSSESMNVTASATTGTTAYERLYAKGKEKNTQARLNAAQQNMKETSNIKRGPRLSTSMQSPNGLYERSLLQKKQREQIRKEFEASEVPSFQPDRITKDKDKGKDASIKTQGATPVWERLHKHGEEKKVLATRKAQEAAEAEMEALKKSTGSVKGASAPGEVPRWQKLYERGSVKRLAAVQSPTKPTTPPRPNVSAKAVSSGSRIDQLYRAGTNNNRRRSAQPKDNRYRSDDDEVAAHCTLRPTLVSSQKKKKGFGAGASSLASGSVAAQMKSDLSLASSHAGNDSIIGRSLEVELESDTPTDICSPLESASPTDNTIEKEDILDAGADEIGTSKPPPAEEPTATSEL